MCLNEPPPLARRRGLEYMDCRWLCTIQCNDITCDVALCDVAHVYKCPIKLEDPNDSKSLMTTHAMLDIAQHIGAWDPKDPKAYTVQEGALVSDILAGMLGPPCDENRDARHKLQLKTQELHAQDPAKAAMKAEVWMFKGDGKLWVNTTSVIKYIYTGIPNNFSRTQKSIFDGGNIPHKLLQVPRVRTTFFIFVPGEPLVPRIIG